MGLLRSPNGTIVSIPDDQEGSAIAGGYSHVSLGEAGATTGAITPEDTGTAGAVRAGASSVLSGLTLGGSDVALKHLLDRGDFANLAAAREQHPLASGAGELAGMLLPALVTGGASAGASVEGLGAKILARTPAAGVARVGATIGGLGEGAGFAGNLAARTAGAGAEGALYGGGQYLSQTALEDKPMSAEGFVGAMGHGALFAAPIGGAFTLAERTLVRARSLFPRAEMTAAAGREAQHEATSQLAGVIGDGDQMAAAARQRIALADAKEGMAASGEHVTRRAFGQADPMALGDQVATTVEKQQIGEALQGFEASKARLVNWIQTEADPELEAALTGMKAPEIEFTGAVPVGEFGAPGARGIKTPDELARLAAGTDAPGLAPMLEQPGMRAMRGGVKGTPVEEATIAREGQLQQGLPESARVGGRYRPDVTTIEGVPEYAKIKAHEGRADAPLEQTLPARAIADRGYYEPPIRPGKPEMSLEESDPVRMAKARQAIAEGQREAIDLNVSPQGKITVTGGRHRLAAAIEADAPIKVKWSSGFEPAESDALRGGARASSGGDLEALLRGTQEQLGAGRSIGEVGAASPARAEYVAGKAARTDEAAVHFRAKATAENYGRSGMAAEERAAQGQRTTAFDIKDTNLEFDAAKRVYRDRSGAAMEPTPVGEMKLGLEPRIEDLDKTAIRDSLRRRVGKDVDMSASLSHAAEIIGDIEAKSATLAEALGADAPAGAAKRAGEYRAAAKLQAETSGASAARAAADIGNKLPSNASDLMRLFGLDAAPEAALPRAGDAAGIRGALEDQGIGAGAAKTSVDRGMRDRMADAAAADRTVVEPGIAERMRAERPAAPSPPSPAATPATAPPAAKSSGLLGKAANVATALEVLHALGVHTPALSAIPVIGPVLGVFLRARAVLGILGRKGGSIPGSTENLIASKAAATRDRIAAATKTLVTTGIKVGKVAGPATAVVLSTKLFPGGKDGTSKDPQVLYHARMDEIARALQPGALQAALADRVQTSDPTVLDAVIAQVQRGIDFLNKKAPKQTVIPGLVPGDGVWKPSKAALDEWAKYVRAVNDPASVLEDLARGKITMEGAEALRVVYPALFAEAQRRLLEGAPQMRKTLPYPMRVAISIMYRIPLDGTMTAQHIQFLGQGAAAVPAPGPGAAPPPMAPALTGPITLGQRTTTALDRRAGA